MVSKAVLQASDSLPILTNGAGMLLGVCIVLLVAAAATSVFLLVLRAAGKDSAFGKKISFDKLLYPIIGAIILGSASGAAAWGSNLWTIPTVNEPSKIEAAYDKVESVDEVKTKPVSATKAEDMELVKSVLGSQYDAANEKAHFDKSGGIGSKSYLLFAPSADDPKVADPCYEIKSVYFPSTDEKTGLAVNPGTQKKVETFTPDGYSADKCGGELKKLSEK